MQIEGMWIGSCRILRRIGGGGMGDVYLAEQPALSRYVAVKVVRAQDGEGAAEPDAAQGDRERADAQLEQEARAIAALDHPHILPLYEFGERDQLRYLVMPYVERGSLADLLRQGAPWGWSAPLAPALAATIIEQTADALQFAHDRHVIHRDVKPGNLLVRLLQRTPDAAEGDDAPEAAPVHEEPENVHILLADFGLARSITESQPNTGARGTPLYSAPEQLDGRPTAASDQYALACVAYFLLTGRPIFTGSLAEICHQHMTVPPLPPTSLYPALPSAVDAALLRALAKRPEERYPGVRAFAQALRAALREPQPTPQALWSAPPTLRESALTRNAQATPAREADVAAPAIPALSLSALAEATTQADGTPGVIGGGRDAASRLRRLPCQSRRRSPATSDAAPPTSSAATETASRPDGPAGQLPFSWRRVRPRSLVAAAMASRRRGAAREDGGSRSPAFRVVAIAVAAVVALSLLGGAGWALTHQKAATSGQSPVQSGALTFLGTVSLASVSGATSAPAPVPSDSAAQRDGALVSPPATLSDYTGLPTLTAPSSDGAATSQPLAVGVGAQGEGAATHPWQTTVDSDGQTAIAVADDTIDVFRLSPGRTLDVAGVVGTRAVFARAVTSGDILDQPRVLFDPATRRWALVARQLSGLPALATGGALDIAVSETSDPMGAWRVFQLNATITALAPCAWADDPRIGENHTSVTLTANLFACGAHGAFLGAGLWDMSETGLMTGSHPVVYAFCGFANTAGRPVFSVVPAVQHDATSTQWLVSDDASYADGAHASTNVILWALEHPSGAAGAPTLVGLVIQAPSPYADPPGIVSAVGAQPLAIGDARPAQVTVNDGKLYAAFATAARWSGDTQARAAIYWLVALLPPAAPGKEPTASAMNATHIAVAGVWGEPGAAYIAPVAVVAPSGALTLAAVRVAAGQAPRVVRAAQQSGALSATLGPTTLVSTDAAPLLWSGQSGASLSGALTSASYDQPTAQSDAIWLVGVTSAGATRWRVQVVEAPAP